MKIRSVLALLVPLVLLMSCNTQNTAQTVEVGNQPIDGTNLRMISLSSGNRYLDVKQTEVLSALEKTINGGEYNIVSVKTSYTDQYPTSAVEVQHLADL